MVLLPSDFSRFLDSVVAIVVATADASLKPEVTRGWGMRVLEDGESVAVSVDRLPARQTLDNLRLDGRVAIACIRPNYAARQLKGRCLEAREPSNADREAVERHRRFYIETGAEYDMPEPVVRRHWTEDVVTLRCHIDEIFDQSPGPMAGRAL